MFGERMTRGEYLESPGGKLSRYLWRKRHRVRLLIPEVEPRGKNNTSPADIKNFQSRVLKQLQTQQRHAFRGPVTIQMSLATSERNPSHLHTIAKNFLDLLSR